MVMMIMKMTIDDLYHDDDHHHNHQEDEDDEDDDDNVGVSRPSANHAYCRRNILNLDWS